MNDVPGLPSTTDVRLALALWPGGARPAWRRRAALALALVLLAALAILVAAGAIGRPRAVSARAVPGARGSPGAAEARVAGAQTQPLAAAPAPDGHPPAKRVVAPAHAAALFAPRSWVVVKPAPLPAPPPPPQPTAPPLPYSFVGSYARGGDGPVFFLSRGDRLIETRVGDRLDGVYQFESAAGGQLVFVYLPLNVRQTLAAGASR